MKKSSWILLLTIVVSCSQKDKGRTFDVDGTVINAASKMIYLEEDVPAGQPVIMDSAALKNDGSFRLQAPMKEESLYQLRLNSKTVPLAFVISDGAKVTVQADAANATQPYTVTGSPATEALINFDRSTTEKAKQLLAQENLIDSLKQTKAPDSVVNTAYTKLETAVNDANSGALQFFKESKSPVLVVYAISSY